MHKYTLLILLVFLLTGCIGLSSYSKQQSLEIELSSDQLTGTEESKINVSCRAHETTKLIMVSPIIPLPPMIPVSDDSDTVIVDIWPTGNLTLTQLSIIDPDKGHTLFHEQGAVLGNLPKTFSVNYECSELEGKQLIQLFTEPESGKLLKRSFNFKYIDEGSDFEWGFLGA